MARKKDDTMITVGQDTGRIGIIPEMDHPYYKQLYEADMKTKRELDTDSVIKMNHNWDVTTCSYVFLRDAIKLIGSTFQTRNDDSILLPITDVMTLGITYSQNDLSEKEGNINTMFFVGEVAEDIAAMKEIHYVTPEAPLIIPSELNEDLYSLIQTLDRATRKDMANEYNYIIGDEWVYLTVATYYFKNLLQQLYIKFMEDGMKSQSLNFFDLIEININPKYADEDDDSNDTIIGKFSIGPGVSAKLGVKNDEYTDPDVDDDLPF